MPPAMQAPRRGDEQGHLQGAEIAGFRFVGPTTIYAFMQSVGMVNDHSVTCHRHSACRSWRGRSSVCWSTLSQRNVNAPEEERQAIPRQRQVGAIINEAPAEP
jgi:hypothetical protein